MPKYLIESELLGAGKLTPDQLKAISKKSSGVLSNLAAADSVDSQLRYRYDKIYCVYRAPNETMIREHAQQGGFPANRISKITSVIDATTAE